MRWHTMKWNSRILRGIPAIIEAVKIYWGVLGHMEISDVVRKVYK